ncbi:uncharacterized protein LOC111133813 isoform X1 [Crassostrea virginica]
MEKNITKHCTYANTCRECSLFIIDQRLDNAANIWWNETCSNYIIKEYEPVTKVKIGITNEILSYNQTRCCNGQRTLFFTESTVPNEHTDKASISLAVTSVNNSTATSMINSTDFQDPGISKGLSIQLLLTVAIVATAVLVLITTVSIIVIVYKRRSKEAQGKTNPMYCVATDVNSDGIAEYSTVEESAILMKSLTLQKNTSESVSDNYFTLEKNENLSVKVEENRASKDIPFSREGIYNTLHETDEQCQEVEENAYSHFGDFDNGGYSEVLRR